MSTFLFDKVIFGPIRSRRLGTSLGVNLLPTEKKVCNFDCIYCECGFTKKSNNSHPLPKREKVKQHLAEVIARHKRQNDPIDSITFAGNGEPTLHPSFSEIIEDVIAIRDEVFPDAKISVLSNATLIHKPNVVEALKKVDNNILKLDGGTLKTIERINKPLQAFDIEEFVSRLSVFNHRCTIQTMFLRGPDVDNTTPEEVEAWIKLILRIAPQEVMMYSIDRDTPTEGLEKVSYEEMEAIARRLREEGVSVLVSE